MIAYSPDSRERHRRVRDRVSLGLEESLSALHRLRTGPHARYALFPALMLAGYGLILAGLTAPALDFSLYLPGVLLAALGKNSSFLVMHEATHGILFRHVGLNRWAGVLLGWFGFTSFSAYQALHLTHHDHLGDALDPDDYDNYTRRRGLVWFLHFNRLAWGTVLYVLVFPFLSMRRAAPEQRRRIAAEYALLALIVAALAWAFPWPALLLGWGVPFLLANWMINVRGFSQHGITDAQDPLLASRTVLPHPWVRFLLLNENFHLEHHLFPGVPGYHLAELHRLIAPRLPRRVTTPSYTAFLLLFLRQSATLDNRPIGLTNLEEARR